jgi:hypothetical protein
MTKKTHFTVRLRRKDTGDEHDRLVITTDEAAAGPLAVMRARAVLPVMADRKYAEFEVVSCVARS